MKGDFTVRSLQGLIFFGLAIFSVKWGFTVVNLAPFTLGFDNVPPMKDWMIFLQAGLLGAIGLYLLVTGEVESFRKKGRRGVIHTFLSGAAFFLAVLSLKFAYYTDPWWIRNGYIGYYPPFSEESLGCVYGLLVILGLYFLARGEVGFWRRKSEANRTSNE